MSVPISTCRFGAITDDVTERVSLHRSHSDHISAHERIAIFAEPYEVLNFNLLRRMADAPRYNDTLNVKGV